MALIEKFHVVAAERTVASGQTILEGQVVSLNSSGYVVLQNNLSTVYPYGLAGDTKNTSASYMPGVEAGWQNRVSDYFDETKASAKMTVYHSGGEFATDMFVVASVGSMTPGVVVAGNNGYLDLTTNAFLGNAYPVAVVTQAVGDYPSGVPGTDINGDMALSGVATAGYIEIKLLI